jgi:hypothetical protein
MRAPGDAGDGRLERDADLDVVGPVLARMAPNEDAAAAKDEWKRRREDAEGALHRPIMTQRSAPRRRTAIRI